MRVEEVEHENKSGCQQRLITVNDLRCVQCPTWQEARKECREPEEQAGDSDDHHAPEYCEVVEFLKIRPAIARRPLAHVKEVLDVAKEVRDILRLRRHGVRAPEHTFLTTNDRSYKHIQYVNEHVAKCADRCHAVQEAGRFDSTKYINQRLGPRCSTELER